MILPGITSPLRPIIAAFYEASQQMGPGWETTELAETVRQILATAGHSVEVSSSSIFDFIVDGEIGVLVVSSTAHLTENQCRIRRMLASEGAPRVALVMAFTPCLRIVRIDAPKNRCTET